MWRITEQVYWLEGTVARRARHPAFCRLGTKDFERINLETEGRRTSTVWKGSHSPAIEGVGDRRQMFQL
jgi:hypothetical protein